GSGPRDAPEKNRRIPLVILQSDAPHHCFVICCASANGRTSGRAGALVRLRSHRLDAAADAIRNGERAVDDLDAGERGVEHSAELAELAGIVDAGERGGEMDRMRVAEPRADMGAETIPDLTGLADARRRERVAQAPELLDLETDGVDDAVRDQGHDLVDGASA